MWMGQRLVKEGSKSGQRGVRKGSKRKGSRDQEAKLNEEGPSIVVKFVKGSKK